MIIEFTGISSTYETPNNPDLMLNTAETNVEYCISQVYNLISNELPIRH
tara:strand:- start:351 stop:497 length:147 start_codon:yes stop_codon:yes gene_type:complete